MSAGIGTLDPSTALANLNNRTNDISPISSGEYEFRLRRLQEGLRHQEAAAAYLHAGTNLRYFTGLQWSPSERMVGAIVPAEGEICYIAPRFELDTIKDYWKLEAEVHTWEEHESPYQLFAQIIGQRGLADSSKPILCDEMTPFFAICGLQVTGLGNPLQSLQPLAVALRSKKSNTEIALLQRAHEITLEVIRSAASILHEGISTTEVVDFIDRAHKKMGAAGSYFCIVLFGVATSFPHGVKDPQILKNDDWVLIDTGCLLDGYNSDITRSFSFGSPTEQQRNAWELEKAAQLAAFEAAGVGVPCEDCDAAARRVLEAAGFGPDYQLPGLPHRTGHGCGLDIHESPNLVRGETTPMEEGMVFSNEPMLVLPGQFGVRLEDHFYISENGPRWFTEPAHSIDDPFANACP